MFVLPFAILSLAVAASSALVIPRSYKAPPPGWLPAILEPYEQYHARYLAIDCEAKHNTTFFAHCCHPMLKGQTLEKDRLPECRPNATATTAALPTSTDDTDCIDGDDHVPTTEQAKSSAHPTTTHAATTTPVAHAAAATPKASTPEASTHKASSTSQAASTPSKLSSAIGSAVQTFTDGFATFFFQNGVAGACGIVHSDQDLIAAIDAERYGNTGVVSPLCGQQVVITNPANGKTVTVTIEDACPTCDNKDSIDLSVAAFEAIADQALGIVPISWHFAT